MKALSIWLLGIAEAFFLLAHGWRKAPEADFLLGDSWNKPDGYPTKPTERIYNKGHAVNSQKWVNRNFPRVDWGAM